MNRSMLEIRALVKDSPHWRPNSHVIASTDACIDTQFFIHNNNALQQYKSLIYNENKIMDIYLVTLQYESSPLCPGPGFLFPRLLDFLVVPCRISCFILIYSCLLSFSILIHDM